MQASRTNEDAATASHRTTAWQDLLLSVLPTAPDRQMHFLHARMSGQQNATLYMLAAAR